MTVIGSAYVDIRAITDKLEGDIRAALKSIQGEAVSVNVEADTLAARSQIDEMMDDIGGARPQINPDVDTGLAEAQLALLTRIRNMRINVKMNSAPLVMAGNAIARMTGARVLVADMGRLASHFINIDKAVPGIAKAATLIGSIGAMAISSIGGLSTLGASLGSIMSMAGIAAPAMATGFIVGIGSLIVALKDFGKQLPEVVAQWKTLATAIRTPFWEVARKPLRDMANTLFPSFKKGLSETGAALGMWTKNIADTIKFTLMDGDMIGGMFKNLNTSIGYATAGSAAMANTLLVLGSVGSTLLPRLASWFTDISLRFNDFIQGAAADGRLNMWIEDGIKELKRLGTLIGETSGIFGGITKAARAAGSDGLGTLISFTTRLNEAINSPEGMKQLTTIFEGANTATSALGDGFFKILGAIGGASPAIKSAFESIGGVVNVVSDAIAKIISNPEFQAGFTAMFDGIEKGFGALMPVIGDSGPKMGAFLSIIGALAANIGGVLGAALEVALPLITELKKAIDPLIPVLGDSLIKIIKELGPTFSILAKAMAEVAPVVADIVAGATDLIVGLIDTLGPALPGVTAAILAFMAGMKLGSIIATVVTGIQNMIKFVGLLRAGTALAAAGQIAFNIALLANPIGLVIGAVAALIAIFVIAYNNVGWFKDGVDAAVKWIGEAWNNMCKWIGEAFENTIKWITDAWNNTSGMFTDFFNNTVGMFTDFFTNTVGMFTDWVGGIVGLATDIGTGISDAFNSVADFVGGVIGTIGSIIAQGVENLVTNWTNAFNVVRDIFVNIWNGLVSFFTPIVTLIATIIGAVIEIAVAIWTAGWEIIFTIFRGIWENLVRFFTPILQSISDFITNTVNGIVTVWNTVWQAIGDFFTTIWNNMVAFYGPILQGIWDFIVAVGAGISLAWTTAWQAIGDFFTTIWNNMVAFYGPILQGIWDFIVAVGAGIAAAWNATWQGISDFFTGVWNGIVAFVSPIVQSISDTIRNVINGIVSFWNTTWSNIASFVSGVWNGIVSGVTSFVGDVGRNITNFLDTVGRIGSDILNKITNFPSLLINAGTDLINGLINGVSAGKDAVINKIKEIAGGALDAIKNFFGIKSPSRVMRDEVGKQLGAGLAIGIEASIGAVLKATDKLAAAAVPDIADIMLPAVRTASVASQRGSGTAAAITRASVTGSSATSNGTGVFGQPNNGGVTNVNFSVNPSPGLNETQIGESAMNYMYWKLSNTL